MPESRQKLTIYSAQGGAQSPPPHVEWHCMPVPQVVRRKMTHGERLLRNSAIACALLFVILSLRNIDQPWAQVASGGVERALTASIDLTRRWVICPSCAIWCQRARWCSGISATPIG